MTEYHATSMPRLVYAWEGEVEKLHAEIRQLRADRAAVYAWMREPDYVENASLEWMADWVNRRPIKETLA